MNLKELEQFLKEMREAGANDDTEVEFKYYYNGVKYLNFSDIYLYFPETACKRVAFVFYFNFLISSSFIFI